MHCAILFNMPHCMYVDGNMLPPSVLGVVSLFTECQNILLTLLYIRRWKQSISVTNIMYVNRISTVKRFSKMIVNCLSFLWFWQLCKHHIVAQHLNCCMSSNPDPAPTPEQASQDCSNWAWPRCTMCKVALSTWWIFSVTEGNDTEILWLENSNN